MLPPSAVARPWSFLAYQDGEGSKIYPTEGGKEEEATGDGEIPHPRLLLQVPRDGGDPSLSKITLYLNDDQGLADHNCAPGEEEWLLLPSLCSHHPPPPPSGAACCTGASSLDV